MATVRDTSPDRSGAVCAGCGQAIEVKGHGPMPSVCAECRKRRNRERTQARREGVKLEGTRPWLSSMACLDCGVDIPPVEPGRRRFRRCPECQPKHRKPYSLDARKQRAKHLWRKYGLTDEAVEVMARSQGGRCAICGDRPDRLHVDHDHVTLRVRALLCGSCNRMLGLAKEDESRLLVAIQYLRLYRDLPPLELPGVGGVGGLNASSPPTR